ncbi:TRAP transporter substrate-binding protein [Marinospirillum alkaliphilum]|uniref:TRAP-type C4-dicarboxylate transport system, substrate-binding protein n=1 Tax=Marinospirillum alkaliphilum DSM 21637 TaxID=1122209 RepID=A0A1K1TH08_9GAMM|nr:TRAP transporter substrate-binding protein [Marinospirillum alkaliphilum]SFW99856.1 TRAP-type C4-dicarboxylate transport system, substrate-binding protein [Marinospirillum alkaliphilum DSM 21637]
MFRKSKTLAVMLTVAGLGLSTMATAQTQTLRVAHFMPTTAPLHSRFIQPWCDRIQEESQGRLQCEIYPAMQLGGTPPQLINQARDGVADIIFTLPGYTPGRFPLTEMFELPFFTAEQKNSSMALWDFIQENSLQEFRGVKPLITVVNGSNYLHFRNRQVQTLEDLRGVSIRGPSRLGNRLIEALGATPVGMPVTQMGESLSRGIIDGTVLPWEAVPAFRLHELTRYHALTEGDYTMLTSTMVFVMNERRYNNLPDDLKKVIDNNSGQQASGWGAEVLMSGHETGMRMARDAGNTIYAIEPAEMQRWRQAGQTVIDRWIQENTSNDVNARALYERGQELIRQHSDRL